MRFLPLALLAGGTAAIALSAPAQATTVDDVIWMIQNSGGRYVPAGASLSGADCSGLVSVAQSLAMGQSPHRLGNTRSLLAGNWPGAIPGASANDQFVIGVNAGHMVARVNGVNIESTTTGSPYRVGAAAASPWSGQFRLYHIDPAILVHGRSAVPPLPGPAPEPVVQEVAEVVPAPVEPLPPVEAPAEPVAMEPAVLEPLPPAEPLAEPIVETVPVNMEPVPATPSGDTL